MKIQIQRGFIGSPVLVLILLGVVIFSGGAYLVIRSNIQSQTVASQQQETALTKTDQPSQNTPPMKTSADWDKFAYAKKGNQIFFIGGTGEENITLNADANSFSALSGDEVTVAFGKDSSHVWVDDTVLINADPATFVVLDAHQGIAADKNTLYFLREDDTRISRADALSFKVLDDYTVRGTFLRSANSLYFYDRKNRQLTIEQNGDPSTFQVIKVSGGYEIYTKDKNNVYCGGKILNGADAATFRIADEFNVWVQDKNHIYDGNCNIVQ